MISCPVTRAHMPAAIDAFANTYLFVVTVRHCVFGFFCLFFFFCLLTGSFMWRYQISFLLFFFKLTNILHFSVFLSSAIICNIVTINATKSKKINLTKSTVRRTQVLKHWDSNQQYMKAKLNKGNNDRGHFSVILGVERLNCLV